MVSQDCGLVNNGQDDVFVVDSTPNENGSVNTQTPVMKNAVSVTIESKDDQERDSWGNKFEFLLATIGFAVGLGNVWRFPYLCQKNGGGAFLIPYFLSLFVLGIPIFLIELGIGQRLRAGAVGAWSQVSPFLGGIGVTSIVCSTLICIYYNMIVAWCFYYLFISFQDPLPYEHCPITSGGNLTDPECQRAGATSYYWYRKTLDLSPSIAESGHIQWHLALVLLLAWLVVFLCTMKGVKSTGKAVYVTALFPYVVLVIFFIRAITLDGAVGGLKRMFTPKFETLANGRVWLEAATQIFFSLSLSFGGLIAMSSYNPVKNNCKKDAIMVSLINCGTSVFASVVVFSVLGFKAKTAHDECIESLQYSISVNNTCKSLDDYLSDVAQGTGLSFIAFTEAITKMPAPQAWSVLFFCMLLTLGLGSMFGNVAGIVTPIRDLGLIKIKKEYLTAIVSLVLFLIGLVMCLNSGEYWLQFFDSYPLNLGLLWVGFFQLIGMNFVYGTERFRNDIEFMTGSKPSWYWLITWRYLGPVLSVLLFIFGLYDMGRDGIGYYAWKQEKGKTERIPFPVWGSVLVILCVCFALLWVPLIAGLRLFGVRWYRAQVTDDNIHETISEFELTKESAKNAVRNGDGKFGIKF